MVLEDLQLSASVGLVDSATCMLYSVCCDLVHVSLLWVGQHGEHCVEDVPIPDISQREWLFRKVNFVVDLCYSYNAAIMLMTGRI